MAEERATMPVIYIMIMNLLDFNRETDRGYEMTWYRTRASKAKAYRLTRKGVSPTTMNRMHSKSENAPRSKSSELENMSE